LVSTEASSVSLASNFLNNAAEVERKYPLKSDNEKLRYKIEDLVRLFNANNKVDSLSSNVL
jgi:hypothetical protein